MIPNHDACCVLKPKIQYQEEADRVKTIQKFEQEKVKHEDGLMFC